MVEIKKIAVATDFSENSQKAMEYAKELAQKFSAKLVVLHVFNKKGPKPPAPYYLEENLNSWVEKYVDKHMEKALFSLGELKKFCEKNGVNCEKHLIEGFPPTEIVKFANEHKVDFLVIGKHGHTNWQDRIFGTTTDYVLHGADCPLILI